MSPGAPGTATDGTRLAGSTGRGVAGSAPLAAPGRPPVAAWRATRRPGERLVEPSQARLRTAADVRYDPCPTRRQPEDNVTQSPAGSRRPVAAHPADPDSEGLSHLLGDAAIADELVAWARDRRWFRGKARRIATADVAGIVPLDVRGTDAALLVLRVHYAEDEEPEDYLVPLARVDAAAAAAIAAGRPTAVIGPIGLAGDVLVDALRIPAVAERLAAGIGRGDRWSGTAGTLVARPTSAYPDLRGDRRRRIAAVPSGGEQSNTSIVLGDRLILKVFRRLEAGVNPDVEVGRVLTRRGFAHAPAVAGALEYEPAGGHVGAAAILQAFVPNVGDAWSSTLETLEDVLEAAAGEAAAPPPVATSAAGLLDLADRRPPQAVRDLAGAFIDRVRVLGERTAELHLVLAAASDDAAFAPEPADAAYQRGVHRAVRTATRRTIELLRRRLATLPAAARGDAEAAIALRAAADDRLARLLERPSGGLRIRVHGDYHLGQVLDTGRDFAIIDFEGEPGRPLAERRVKQSPLVDVAGMLRSFSYAAAGTLVRRAGGGDVGAATVARLEPWVVAWTAWVSASFLAGYRATAREAPMLPADDAGWAALLDAFLLQKALYELDYELNNRPAWVGIPLRGIVGLLRA
jgi:trehalose synthase-fused probable maltokinase